MKFYIIVFLISFTFIGCDDTDSDNENYAYFGGEIVNPNNNYVTLDSYRSGKDTIYLDDNNRFLKKIEDIQPGLFIFSHGGEIQSVLLEERDSLFLRLNTDDFDESLVYTGNGAKKNNFIIKSFLADEEEDHIFLNHQQLEPEEFERHIKLQRFTRQKELESFLEKTSQSELFENLAYANIEYNLYHQAEKYPFGHFGENKLVHFKDLPDDFYDFRKEIDYNDENLIGFLSYRRFLVWHFNNLALNKFYPDDHHTKFDRQSLEYNVEKLNIIKDKVKSEKIRDFLLKSTTQYYFLHSDNPEASIKIRDAYLDVAGNEEDKTYIKKLYNQLQLLKPGNPIPNSELYNYDRETVDLHSVITQPTVIFCWLSRNKLLTRNSHYMAKSLKARFPEIDFIAINVTDNDLENWKRTVSRFDYPKEKEYLFKNSKLAIEDYVIAYGQRVFIVDQDGIIVNSNANLFSDEIQDELESLLERITK